MVSLGHMQCCPAPALEGTSVYLGLEVTVVLVGRGDTVGQRGQEVCLWGPCKGSYVTKATYTLLGFGSTGDGNTVHLYLNISLQERTH